MSKLEQHILRISKQLDVVSPQTMLQQTHLHLRLRLMDRFYEWGVCEIGDLEVSPDEHASALLAELFGYEDYNEFVRANSEDDVERMKKLLGEHGWVIYKILEARIDRG